MSTDALCGDCLRIEPAHPDNLGTCRFCGGETCHCEGCQWTAFLLRWGVTDYRTLGLQHPIKSWSRAEGCHV